MKNYWEKITINVKITVQGIGREVAGFPFRRREFNFKHLTPLITFTDREHL